MAGKKNLKKNNRFQTTPFLAVLIILIITYISFSPAQKLDFTTWDDPVYVLDNNLLKEKSLHLKDIFTTPVSLNYHPLTVLTLAWNYKASVLKATSYHFTNI